MISIPKQHTTSTSFLLTQTTGDSVVDSVTRSLMDQWPEASESAFSKTVILIGGYQGSGKSTLARSLAEEAGLTVISRDRIRFLLQEKGKLTDPNLKAVYHSLLAHALCEGRAFAVDANAHPSRIAEITKMLEEHPDFRVIKIMLNGSEAVLEERITQRQENPEAYNGTVDELHDSMNKHKLKPEDYDAVFDIESYSAEDISERIMETLLRPSYSERRCRSDALRGLMCTGPWGIALKA